MGLLIASAAARPTPGRGRRGRPRGSTIVHSQGKAREHEEERHQAGALQSHHPVGVVFGVAEAVEDHDPDGGDASKANMGLHVRQRRWWWWVVYDGFDEHHV